MADEKSSSGKDSEYPSAARRSSSEATRKGNAVGARNDGNFMAICTAPSINWTPAGAGRIAVPYQTVQDLSNSVKTAKSVRFNGSPVYLLDQSSQPAGTGDERGSGKGIRSGTVTGEVKPISGCRSVRIEGKQVVRVGDRCTMNGGNKPGIYVSCQKGDNTADSASPFEPPAELVPLAISLYTSQPSPSRNARRVSAAA
jgi:uncharacterized Zn-binding protein involved in type VI secretion